MRQIESTLWTLLMLALSMVLPSAAWAEGGHQLTVKAKPAMAGTFNKSEAELVAGQSIQMVAYANASFTFLRWTDEEGNVVSQQRDITYVMPARDVTLTAEYEYNPTNPANPARNHWNAALGEVIVDDFTTGALQNAVKDAIGSSKAADVMMITVAGVMNSNDFGIINTYQSCTLLDLSRVTGITQVPSYAFDYTKLESVYLPATIEKIGQRAFYICQQLASLIVYAMTPPTLEADVFTGVPEGLVVYVPAAAIAQYQEADGWKDFTLLPIQEDIRSITISLPEGTNAADYAQMWLELTNTKSGQRMHYVMTDRQQYTFANIIRNTSWNVTLRNERGDIFGQIDNVEVKDEDVSVVFSTLSKPQNVSLVVKTPDEQDVTAQTQITWTDAQGNYVAQGASLTGLPAGYQANYCVALSQELAMQYVTPQMVEYVLKDGDNSIVYQLEAIKQLQITGKVKDAATGLPLSGAVVSASQTFGGKYSKTLNAKTDNNGVFTLTIANVPTSVAFAASDYVSQTVDLSNYELSELSEFAVPDVSLKSITGATISIGFTYTPCEGESQNWYSDYQNVSYTLYNTTREKPISQFNVQYPQIVLLEEVEDGDVLRLQATSRTNAFKPVETTATIAEQKAEATFGIVELGQIRSTFTTTGNASVVGSLYDVAGKLVKTYDYANASLTISNLADGSYTLVTMGSSRLFNTIYDLSQLPQTGLVEGADYVLNTVEVKSGQVSAINISEVPTLEESKLYYTGDNTSFTVNKPSIVAGNYLTLTGRIDFKQAYATNVSNVQMIVDLPESCEFVENSVMVGNSTSSYTLDGNRITIPMPRYTDRVRFCIIPTLGGDYAPSAFAQFDIDSETVTQPIGSANYTAKDLSISVPPTVAKTTIPVSGTAIGTSNVEIYDNGVLVGQTTSLANGTWATTCELNEPYNLSRHQIYAKVTTKQGIELYSEKVELTYDMNAIQVSKVKMYHDNPEMHKTYEIIFDFLNPSTESQYYIYYIYNKKFTFTIDFTSNDTTKISNVVLNVKTGNGTEIPLNAAYDKKQDLWVASGEFGNMYDGNIPVNVSVDYYCGAFQVVDRAQINADCVALENSVTASLEEKRTANEDLSLSNKVDEIFNVIDDILEADSLDVDALNAAFDIIISNPHNDVLTSSEEVIDSLKAEFNVMYEEWENHYLTIEKDSLLDSFFDSAEIDYNYSKTFPKLGGSVTYTFAPISIDEIKQLPLTDYDSYDLTDSLKVYYKYREYAMEFIDVSLRKRFVISSVDDINGARAASKRISRDDFAKGVNACANSISTTMKSIKALWSSGKLTTKQACSQFKSLYGFAQCYYTAILSNANYSLVVNINKAIEDYDIRIKAGEELRDLSESRVLGIKEKLLENDKLKKQVDELLAKNQEALLHGNLSDSEYKALTEQSAALRNQSQYYKAEIEAYKGALKHENSEFAKYKNQVENLLKGRKGAVQAKSKINSLLAKLPKSIIPGGKAAKVMAIGGKLAGFFGEVLRVWSFGVDVIDAANELDEWGQLEDAIERKLPCENDHEKALALQKSIHSDATKVLAHYMMILSSEVGAMSFDLAGGVPGVSPTWWGGAICDIYAEWAKFLAIEKYIGKRGNYWLDIMYLQCTGKEPKDPRPQKDNPNDDNGKKKRHEDSNNNDSGKGIDPSGFVFEGVATNRIEGVTATIYYKEDVEDMYGDLYENIVKWDAEEYAQENPLFTDENGFYRWDVPNGLWQVKFEKEGYETTYSEWLPVPPPQLDVNIAMKQNRQPEVKVARAYEDAVEVEFDKYMIPELLTAENIMVMQNGTAVEGTVELLNEETAYEGSNESFASKVRFNAAQPFTEQEITLLVNNRVKSYAGIRMQDNYEQTFTIEQEIKQIVSDSVLTVGYGNVSTLVVSVLPASASKGKTLTVKTSSPMILGVETEQVAIGNDGKAEITVSGELPGTAALTFSVEGTDKTAMTIANVEQIVIKTVATPKASIASGTLVEKGTAITLTCETEGATIYYTTDGSCPCDNTNARKVYDGTPIIINESVTIKAMAVASDMYESEVAEFTYIVDDATGINEVTLNDEIQVYPLPVRDILNVTANGKIIKSVTVSSMNGVLVASANKAATKVTLNISTMPTGIYIINVVTESGSYSRKILKVD